MQIKLTSLSVAQSP